MHIKYSGHILSLFLLFWCNAGLASNDYETLLKRQARNNAEEVRNQEAFAKAQERLENDRKAAKIAVYGDKADNLPQVGQLPLNPDGTIRVEDIKIPEHLKTTEDKERYVREYKRNLNRLEKIRKDVKAKKTEPTIGVYVLSFVLLLLVALSVGYWLYLVIKNNCKQTPSKGKTDDTEWTSKEDFLHPYRFEYKENGIVEVYEKINGEPTLTGQFDKTKMAIKPLHITEDTLKHLMDLFFNKRR